MRGYVKHSDISNNLRRGCSGLRLHLSVSPLQASRVAYGKKPLIFSCINLCFSHQLVWRQELESSMKTETFKIQQSCIRRYVKVNECYNPISALKRHYLPCVIFASRHRLHFLLQQTAVSTVRVFIPITTALEHEESVCQSYTPLCVLSASHTDWLSHTERKCCVMFAVYH